MPLLGWEKVSRDNPDYQACMVATTAAGAIAGGAYGSLVPVTGTAVGFVSGALWGLAAGYLTCPYLVPKVRQKIENGTFLTDTEIRSAAEAMGRYARVQNASDAVKLLGMVKAVSKSKLSAPACSDPAYSVKTILEQA